MLAMGLAMSYTKNPMYPIMGEKELAINYNQA
jgi:hypothetical protein